MSRIVTVLVVLAMIAHVIRPFGLPGLSRRSDAWKLALVGIGIVLLTAALRPE
ncbi:hypothetical protein [Amorphus orientalis]|uniref:Uncharacterized protein n=1 Tax=Amorphus orientalis TaxID=649198 RepID=A0AAE4ASL8_9HYPH|nr:hypothetical protein [Amorphus orientalis]MDQ0314099.1 hypothetical protein [Amorphus orientalis]